MAISRNRNRETRRHCRIGSAALVFLVLTGVGGCDSLLEVDLPTRVNAESLADPALAFTLVNGAIADFECGYAGYVAATGLLTDEFISSGIWRVLHVWDNRIEAISDFGDVECGGDDPPANDEPNQGTYQPLQTARFQAEDAAARLEEFPDDEVPNKAELIATANAYEGYSLTILGEGFCEIAIDGGPSLTRADVLAIAEQRFTSAIDGARAAGTDEIENMALVGRARVRLDLGKTSEAAADAGQVPEGFVKNATYSGTTARRANRAYTHTIEQQYQSVHPSFRNLTVDGVPDPRVVAVDVGTVGSDGVTPHWNQQKYTSVSDPIPIASWEEAQLIIAEANGGQAAVDIINRLRDKHELPQFSSNDTEEIRLQVLEERRRQLFFQGHRNNDLIRLNITWEQGFTGKGAPYGPVTCMALPSAEFLNNPNF